MTILSIDQPTRRAAQRVTGLTMVRQRGGGTATGDGRRSRLVEAGLRRHPSVRATGSGASDTEVERTLFAIHDLEYLAALHDAEDPTVAIDADVVTCAGEAVRTAISAARHVAAGGRFAYALCRPPGHQAGPAFGDGACCLNTTAAAAQALREAGAGPVGILDLDLHYPNGTSAIVAGMADVALHSLHASSAAGTATHPALPRTGRERLVGFHGAPDPESYLDAVDESLEALARTARVLVVTLGYDGVAGDPSGSWDFEPGIFAAIGRLLAVCGLPVCVVQEGGTAVEQLADCSGAFASGLLASAAV
jgi:acetoin utilization deacetylase AcuC-like enzyme